MNIGDKIKAERREGGLTQSKLTDKVGISRNYISDLENNRYVPSVKTLSKIASVLRIDLNFLIEMSEIQNK